jgi:tRNA A37 threonylcarbamoyladenosine dehydratase
LHAQQQNQSVDAELESLECARVVAVGLGGGGIWADEALCLSGIGNIVLIDPDDICISIDLDDICISNTNRQNPYNDKYDRTVENRCIATALT